MVSVEFGYLILKIAEWKWLLSVPVFLEYGAWYGRPLFFSFISNWIFGFGTWLDWGFAMR